MATVMATLLVNSRKSVPPEDRRKTTTDWLIVVFIVLQID